MPMSCDFTTKVVTHSYAKWSRMFVNNICEFILVIVTLFPVNRKCWRLVFKNSRNDIDLRKDCRIFQALILSVLYLSINISSTNKSFFNEVIYLVNNISTNYLKWLMFGLFLRITVLFSNAPICIFYVFIITSMSTTL